MTRLHPTTYDAEVVQVGGYGIRLRIADAGVVGGGGVPLLLLNGLTRPLESWGPFEEALARRTLVSLDAPGVGKSRTPLLPLSIAMLARLAASVLDHAGFERADVLGFSHGGAVAQQLAFQSPERVRALVLAATSCGVGATPGSQDALATESGLPDDAPHPIPRLDPVGTLWQYLAISTWSSIPFLGAIRTPTLVVCGEDDQIAPPANSALLARRIPGAQLVMLRAGHDLQRPGPAEGLARAVDRFLAEKPSPGEPEIKASSGC